MRQKQVRTSLSDDEITRLEAAAVRRGASLSDEIRWRVLWSLKEEAKRADIARLHAEIDQLIRVTEHACGRPWNEHPAAGRVLLRALQARLARRGVCDSAGFASGELPADRRLVSSDDPDVIGVAVEALAGQPSGILDTLDMIAGTQRLFEDPEFMKKYKEEGR